MREKYEPHTIETIQGSISRLEKKEKKKRQIETIQDREFSHSRDVLMYRMKEVKSKGFGSKTIRADPFTEDEIQRCFIQKMSLEPVRCQIARKYFE